MIVLFPSLHRGHWTRISEPVGGRLSLIAFGSSAVLAGFPLGLNGNGQVPVSGYNLISLELIILLLFGNHQEVVSHRVTHFQCKRTDLQTSEASVSSLPAYCTIDSASAEKISLPSSQEWHQTTCSSIDQASPTDQVSKSPRESFPPWSFLINSRSGGKRGPRSPLGSLRSSCFQKDLCC